MSSLQETQTLSNQTLTPSFLQLTRCLVVQRAMFPLWVQMVVLTSSRIGMVQKNKVWLDQRRRKVAECQGNFAFLPCLEMGVGETFITMPPLLSEVYFLYKSIINGLLQKINSPYPRNAIIRIYIIAIYKGSLGKISFCYLPRNAK